MTDGQRTVEDTCAYEDCERAVSEDERCYWHREVDGKCPEEDLELDDGFPTDLTGAYLQEAKIRKALLGDPNHADRTPANLTNANLYGADLTDANLSQAHLVNVNLKHADLTDVSLWDANLTGANLRRADLTDAHLRGVNLTDARLFHTKLTGTRITYANLTNAFIQDADPYDTSMKNSNLTDVDLQNADLTDGSLFRINLKNSNLKHANITNAYLADADLADANLRSANLTDSNLRNANLNSVSLYNTDLSGVEIDERTTARPPSGYEQQADEDATPDNLPEPIATRLRLFTRSNSDPDDLQRAEQQYRRIERLYRENDLRPNWLSELEIQEKHARRKRALAEGDYTGWLRRAFSRWILGYGLLVKPIIGVMLAVILVSTLLYPVFGFADGTLGPGPASGTVAYDSVPPSLSWETLETLGRSLYFSTITFSTLGYGDLSPTGWARGLATVESFLGAVLMAYLVSVLSRRAIR